MNGGKVNSNRSPGKARQHENVKNSQSQTSVPKTHVVIQNLVKDQISAHKASKTYGQLLQSDAKASQEDQT